MKNRNKYYNPNPLKKETGDCVIRAICKALDKEWDDVYRGLCEIGFRLKVMPNCDDSWKEYLIQHGFIYHKLQLKKGQKRPTVSSFAESHKKGVFLLRVANHVVTCKDGYYYDLYDFGSSALYGHWEKPNN